MVRTAPPLDALRRAARRRLPLPVRVLGFLLVLGALPVSAAPDAAPVSPGAVQGVLAGLGSSTAARRLEALRALAHLVTLDPQVGVRALPRLRAILRLRGPAERALALALLARVPDAQARAAWLRALDPDVERDDAVLAAALEAPRHVPGDAALAKALLGALGEARATPARRALLIEALGWLASPAATLLLERARPGETWVEASARALALGHRRTPRSIPPLLALLRHADLAPRVHAWESLVRLTGRPLPLKAGPWEAWWAQQDPTRAPAPPQPAAAGARYAAPRPRHVPHYYGIPIPRTGSRVAFCLDASQSMYGTGIDEARRELARAVMDLPSTHRFEIVVFNERVLPWAGRLVRAHPVQKWLAIRHLEAIEPTSYTNLFDAVETAFGYAGRGPHAVEAPRALDAVFLLSDGAPNRGRYRTPERVVQHIAELSGGDIPVHTIGAGEEVFPLLRAIARATGGTFVDAFQ